MSPASKADKAASKPVPAASLAKAQKAYMPAKTKKNPQWDLVEAHLPLVKAIVSRMRIHFPAEYDNGDIHSIAVTGLISAAQNFDTTKNASFGGYAAIRVRGALLDELRKMDWMPRQERIDYKKFRKIEGEMEQKLGRVPTDEEVSKSLNMREKDLRILKEHGKAHTFVPLDNSQDSNDGGMSLMDILSDANQQDARDHVERKELIELLRVRLDKLPEMPKKVLAMYYLKGLRLAEIAESVGLTESRICQIHAQAISDLRKTLTRQLSK